MNADDAANATIIANGYGEALKIDSDRECDGGHQDGRRGVRDEKAQQRRYNEQHCPSRSRPGVTDQGHHPVSGQIDSTGSLQCD